METKNIKQFFYSDYNSPLGNLKLICKNNHLIRLNFDKKYNLEFEAIKKDDIKIFLKTKKWLDRYFNKEKPDINELDIKLQGSSFRKEVWEIVSKIPYGQVITYGQIAKLIAEKRGIVRMSAQAIGNAISDNPIPIIIPCHRVIGNNGKLIGYSGGIEKKIMLLKLENITNFSN